MWRMCLHDEWDFHLTCEGKKLSKCGPSCNLGFKILIASETRKVKIKTCKKGFKTKLNMYARVTCNQFLKPWLYV